MQRTALTALVAVLVVSAGCTGLITGDEVSFEASEASVSDSELDSTGYEGQNSTEQTVTRNVSVGGQERTVTITNHFATYTRSENVSGVETPEASQFVVISTPGAQMAGQTLNPLARLSNRELVDRLADRTGSIEDVQFEENRTVESLSAEREVSVFSGTTTMEGQEVDIRIHITSFEHEGDVIVAAGVHPVIVEEEENIDELLGGLEHNGSDS